MAAIVLLATVDGAAVAEEIPRIGVGAVPDVLDAAQASAGEAGANVAGKIEQGMAGASGEPEEPLVRLVGRRKAGNEFGSDLVAGLADQRPERGHDAGAFAAAAFHRCDRRTMAAMST